MPAREEAWRPERIRESCREKDEEDDWLEKREEKQYRIPDQLLQCLM